MKNVLGFPKIDDRNFVLDARVHETSAYVKTQWTISKICLQTATLQWLFQYPRWTYSHQVSHLPRKIQVFKGTLWIDPDGLYLAELLPCNDGRVNITVRDTREGTVLWQNNVNIPVAAEWAENEPAWQGAPTEEIDAFLCDGTPFLVLGLARRSRQSGCSNPSQGIYVMDFAPYACQLDMMRFEPMTGRVLWEQCYPSVYADIIERQSFRGLWSQLQKAGVISLNNGENRMFFESAYQLGRLVQDRDHFAVSWHSKKQVGVEWFDRNGTCVKSASWDCPKVKSTMLHSTDAGLALQMNDERAIPDLARYRNATALDCDRQTLHL